DRLPSVAGVRRSVHLPAGRSEVDATRLQRVHRHGIAQDVHVAVALGQAGRQRLPLAAATAAAVDAQLAVLDEVQGIAGDGHDVQRFRLMRVYVDDEAKVGGQVAADLA